MPTMFRGPRQRKKVKIFKVSGGTGGSGGGGGVNGGSGGLGEGPRLKIVSARTVMNISKNYSTASPVPSGFRTIPLGDIDLQREIRLDNDYSGVVGLRKLHSAKIDRGASNVTVAVYHGDGAEEEWRLDVEKYMAFRHPNIVQLYGTASSGHIYATVFHDDLIPVQQVLDIFQHSNLRTVYIHAYIDFELKQVYDYFRTIFPEAHLPMPNDLFTFFIRRSTGQLCMDLVPGSEIFSLYPIVSSAPTHWQGLEFLTAEGSEATIIDSLPPYIYHSLCYWGFSTTRSMSIDTAATLRFNSAYHCISEDKLVEIACYSGRSWLAYWCVDGAMYIFEHSMCNNWARVRDITAILDNRLSYLVRSKYGGSDWLSQANHIFTTLEISSNFHEYVIADKIEFKLTVSNSPKADISRGFLFVCTDFEIGPCLFKWPACPAYWSLDPSGAERLTSEEAANLGFPSFSLSTKIVGRSWDARVYAGLRQFHRGKGFDPDSQDVARHRGDDLYQLPGPFAHIDVIQEMPLSSMLKFLLKQLLLILFYMALFFLMYDK